jgi:hypothetical protein
MEDARRASQSSLQVVLVTVGQGSAIFEKFGHNALWFVDSAAGVDVAYNWGIFDFAQPGFLRRFLTGDTRYWVEGYPGSDLIDYYKRSDRTVVIQRLNLTPAQAASAYEYARWNAREENKYYRYDYFRDNCSTRVRDVIDRALGGALKAATSGERVARTYRTESVRLTDDMPLSQLGIDVALGHPADAPLSRWEGMFIPMRMRDDLRAVRVPGAAGPAVPLVAGESVLYESTTQREREEMPGLWFPYLLIGLLLAGAIFLFARLGERTSVADRVFRIEATLWAAITGLLGLVLLLAWTSTQHVFWFRNENLLLLSPLALWLAVLTPMAMRRDRWARPAAVCAVLIALLSAVALMLKGVPAFSQNNVPIILLFLPPHFAIAYGLWRRAPNAERQWQKAKGQGPDAQGQRPNARGQKQKAKRGDTGGGDYPHASEGTEPRAESPK